ncbi:hypothetical protein [Mesorhizobium sp. L2C084A000]|uniref:hypothetical protein n=1 Tax=Mesorhizobium sp. L2C084A000 TaxID=1287116 RepID=UPI0012DC8FD8|nr:hypothetical protein [Mesorhizobium sp. L2C084A000]
MTLVDAGRVRATRNNHTNYPTVGKSPQLMQSDGTADDDPSGAHYTCRWRLAIRRKRGCSDAFNRRWQKDAEQGTDFELTIYKREEIKC